MYRWIFWTQWQCDCDSGRHVFRPVDDGTIAQVINRVEEEKMREAQLSTSSSLSVAGSEQSLTDDSRGLQVLAVIDSLPVSADSRQPEQSSGWWLPLSLYFAVIIIMVVFMFVNVIVILSLCLLLRFTVRVNPSSSLVVLSIMIHFTIRYDAMCYIYMHSKSGVIQLNLPLLRGTLVVGVSQTAALNRGRHLYSGGRPSRWALAHISRCCSSKGYWMWLTCLVFRHVLLLMLWSVGRVGCSHAWRVHSWHRLTQSQHASAWDRLTQSQHASSVASAAGSSTQLASISTSQLACRPVHRLQGLFLTAVLGEVTHLHACMLLWCLVCCQFGALTRLVGWQEGHPAYKNTHSNYSGCSLFETVWYRICIGNTAV